MQLLNGHPSSISSSISLRPKSQKHIPSTINLKGLSSLKWRRNSVKKKPRRNGNKSRKGNKNKKRWLLKKVKRKEENRLPQSQKTLKRLKLKCNREKKCLCNKLGFALLRKLPQVLGLSGWPSEVWYKLPANFTNQKSYKILEITLVMRSRITKASFL